MKKTRILVSVGIGAGLGIAWLLGPEAIVSRAMRVDSARLAPKALERASETRSGRSSPREEVPVIPRADFTREKPTNESELAALVAWMRTVGQEELLRLSNAEFGFEESELVELLQGLEGPWVVQALGDLAVAEADPLSRAILVKGLVGSIRFERLDDERLIPVLESLLTSMRSKLEDPHGVGGDLATAAYAACARGDQDYQLLMREHLALSDNRALLTRGYLCMGVQPGGEAILEAVLTSHENQDGRLGALEGLRKAAMGGRISPQESTALGLAALETETSERNRLLLYEMVLSAGGAEGVDAVEGMLRAGAITEIDKTVELLALELEPLRARALFQDLLELPELERGARQALYNALGLVEGNEGVDLLLDVASDPRIGAEERLAGLRGLWNRPVDEALAQRLRDVFDAADDSALRTETLRMLALGGDASEGIDLRAVAVLDEAPDVRAEAVKLAAMQPGEGTREWLEGRLLQDDSFEVKSAALGALVFEAHYTGEGERVLSYLARARQFTDDAGVLAMIAEGEEMVREDDPRRLDLELAGEAKFWGTVARYAEGPASMSFQRTAKQLDSVVSALRATREARRPGQ